MAAGSSDDDLDALLAAIHEDPDDTARRLVYADRLSERGDPRGEFIVLQCNRAPDAPPSPRESDLQREFGKAWVGPLAPVLGGLQFERGFLQSCLVHRDADRAELAATAGAREWSTVRTLLFDRASGATLYDGSVPEPDPPALRILRDPVLRNARCVGGINGRVFSALCAHDAPFRTIGVHMNIDAFEGVDALPEDRRVARPGGRPGLTDRTTAVREWFIEAASNPPGLPALRNLRLVGMQAVIPDARWIVASPLAARLDTLQLDRWGGCLEQWLEIARSAGPGLRRLVVRDGALSDGFGDPERDHGTTATWRYEFERGTDGMLSSLMVAPPSDTSHRDVPPSPYEALAVALNRTPRDGLTRLRVVETLPMTDSHRTWLSGFAAHFGQLETVEFVPAATTGADAS